KFEKVYPLSKYENSTENIQIKNEQSLSETTTEGGTFEQDLEVIEGSQEIDNFEQ
ncbi:3713_t:CDS:1, partial [Ambispora gerdemannii]